MLARQTQHSIGNECTFGVPKCKDDVGVIEASALRNRFQEGWGENDLSVATPLML
jgi:hypothetical protein